jgi:hypothetical protein
MPAWMVRRKNKARLAPITMYEALDATAADLAVEGDEGEIHSETSALLALVNHRLPPVGTTCPPVPPE